MQRIVLSPEQAQVLFDATQLVEVVSPEGDVLGCLNPPWSANELAEAERVLASAEPGYSYQEVREILRGIAQP